MFNFYLLVLCFHLVEHLFQVTQIYILGWPPQVSGGLLGLFYPQLIHNEILHFSIALFHLVGLFYFRKLFKNNLWWDIAIYVQIFHFSEHVGLLSMWLNGVPMNERISPVQELLGVTRPILHLAYNLIAMTPIILALKNRK